MGLEVVTKGHGVGRLEREAQCSKSTGAYDHIRKTVTQLKLQAISLYLMHSSCRCRIWSKNSCSFWWASCTWLANQSLTSPEGTAAL